MKTAHDIVLKPVITENSMAGIADKKYTFKVATDATKVCLLYTSIDPTCFMIVSHVTEVSGRGFSLEKDYQAEG